MKAKKPSQRSIKLKAHPRKVRRSPEGATGCGYTMNWTLMDATRGYTQVWVPTKMYDKVASRFIKTAKGRYEKNLLRQRMAPLGLNPVCGGTCEGGWCKEVIIFDGGSSKVYVCECSYYV
jgi:hypothetical protein